jgi:hypothetical protein
LSRSASRFPRAQWIVYDPTKNMQQIMAQAQNIPKYIEMANNQVQQIGTLTDQFNEFKHYESLFGDPKAVLLTTVQPLVNDLRKTELGQTLTALEGAVDADEAMLYKRTSDHRAARQALSSSRASRLGISRWGRCGSLRDPVAIIFLPFAPVPRKPRARSQVSRKLPLIDQIPYFARDLLLQFPSRFGSLDG